MRISTFAMQNTAVQAIENAQAQLSKTQNQVATGKRVQSPADDPGAAVHILALQQQLAASDQYNVNSTAVQNRLQASELGLADATAVLQRVHDLAVQANSGTLNAGDLRNINAEINSQIDSLSQIANRQDPSGEYLYAGLATATKPFARAASGMQYLGDAGTRSVQVSATQRIVDGQSGVDVFMRVPAGNGTFTTAANSANTGTGTIDGGTLTDPTAWVADNYTLKMTTLNTYQILDGSGTQIATGTYTAGNAIQFRGASVVLSGAPAIGDQFQISRSGTQDVFTTLDKLSSALTSAPTTPAQRAQFATQMGSLLTQLGQSIDHLQNVRADVGAKLSAIDAASNTRADQKLQLSSALSDLSDVDYAQAVSKMNQQLLGLQAAQQSYAKISQLSLFNYL